MVLCLEHDHPRDRLPAWKMTRNKQSGSLLLPLALLAQPGRAGLRMRVDMGRCDAQDRGAPPPSPRFLGEMWSQWRWTWPLKFPSAMEPLSQSQGADTDLSVQGVLPFSPVPSVLFIAVWQITTNSAYLQCSVVLFLLLGNSRRKVNKR